MKKTDDLIAEELEKWFFLEILPLLGGASDEEGTAVGSNDTAETSAEEQRPVCK